MNCDCNRRLRCWITINKYRNKHCPHKKAFWNILEREWVSGREPNGIDWGAIRGTNRLNDYSTIKKSWYYNLFNNGNKAYNVLTEQEPMTKDACKDFIIAGKQWEKERFKMRYEQGYGDGYEARGKIK